MTRILAAVAEMTEIGDFVNQLKGKFAKKITEWSFSIGEQQR